jgi:hypothetical protein
LILLPLKTRHGAPRIHNVFTYLFNSKMLSSVKKNRDSSSVFFEGVWSEHCIQGYLGSSCPHMTCGLIHLFLFIFHFWVFPPYSYFLILFSLFECVKPECISIRH